MSICKHDCLIPIGTQRMKICVDCGTKFKWDLDTDQLSMYGDTSEKSQRDYSDSNLPTSEPRS